MVMKRDLKPNSSIDIYKNILPLTPPEQNLLNLYECIKIYEKQASLYASKLSLEKLRNAEHKFQQKKRQKNCGFSSVTGIKVNKRPEQNYKIICEQNEHEYDDDKVMFKIKKRPIKMEQFRERIGDAREQKEDIQKKAQKTEKMKEDYLKDGDCMKNVMIPCDLGPKLVKKPKRDELYLPSLISTIDKVTPLHEFGESFGMKNISSDGSILFPINILEGKKISDTPLTWSPPSNASFPEDRCLQLKLMDFQPKKALLVRGKYTLGIKFTAPSESNRFSINIKKVDNQNYKNVLFHFNPRQNQNGGQLVLNDKQDGIWGQSINIPLSTLPLIFGQRSCTLQVQIHENGFDVFLEKTHCARLEHRTSLPYDSDNFSLVLQVPSTDDYGNPECCTIYKVWWGKKSIMSESDLSSIPGVNTISTLHPRKLFVSGLTKIFSEKEVDRRCAELERVFHKYAGAQGAIVTVPMDSTFAFVELDTKQQTDLALKEMGRHYRLNRARRSRQETLKKDHLAMKSSYKGSDMESSEWD